MPSYVPILVGKSANAFSKERGHWIAANIEQDIGWPEKKSVVEYRGEKILLLPSTKLFYSCAAVITSINNMEQSKKLLNNFFSALVWHYPGKLRVVEWTRGGIINNQIRLPRSKIRGTTSLCFRPSELCNVKNSSDQLALAFYREGLSINHIGYSVLSLYKIINMKYPDGNKQKNWIRSNILLLNKIEHIKYNLKEISENQDDLAEYIYHGCRCAVAHASMEETTFDPENDIDEIRFYKIRPIVIELVKVIIEREFGIKTLSTIYKEHLYELEGFREMFGLKLSSDLKAGINISTSDIRFNAKISLRVLGRPKYKAFEKLTATIVAINNGKVTISLTRDNTIQVTLILDFPAEKLIFDPMSSPIIHDDNTKNAALQIIDTYRFYDAIISNGVLEVWDPVSKLCLGRLDEYTPINSYHNPEYAQQMITMWKEIARKRSDTK